MKTTEYNTIFRVPNTCVQIQVAQSVNQYRDAKQNNASSIQKVSLLIIVRLRLVDLCICGDLLLTQ